jgi:uncharacterized protein
MITVNKELWVDVRTERLSAVQEAKPSSYVISVSLSDEYWLLFNGLTGAMDIIESADYDRLFCASGGRHIGGGTPRNTGGSTSILPQDRVLMDRGYFLDIEDESRLVAHLNRKIMGGLANEPMCFFLAPTNFCAVGCNYCIEAENPKNAMRVSLDPERVSLAFDAMKRLMNDYHRDEGFILLFGGEPMQPYSFNTVADILKQCRNTGLKIFCFTSGLDLKRYAPLLEEYLDVVLGVCVTLDGRPEFHDSKRAVRRGFKKASEGIDLLLEHKVPIMVRTNVARETFEEIPWLRQYYMDKGWWENKLCSFELNPLTNHGNYEGQDNDCPSHFETAAFFLDLVRRNPDYRRFRFVGLFSYLYYGIEQLGLLGFHEEELGVHAMVPRMYGCPSTGAFTFTLDANGSIRMCNEQVGSSDAPVGRYWPDYTLDKDRVHTWEVRTPDVLDMCKECNHRFFCGGGCSLRSMREEGVTQDGTPYSDLSKGICGTLQPDFQDFFSSIAAEILDRWLPHTNQNGNKI